MTGGFAQIGAPTKGPEVPTGKSGGFRRIHLVLILAVCCLLLVFAAVTALVLSDGGEKNPAVEKPAVAAVNGSETTSAIAPHEEGEIPIETEKSNAHLWPTDRYPIAYEDLVGYGGRGGGNPQ